MDLDNLSLFSQLDPERRIDAIQSLPDHLMQGWQLGQALPLSGAEMKQIVLCGMGESAEACELAASLASSTSRVPVAVIRGYELPFWARGPETLVVVVSLSGATEETLSLYQHAKVAGASILAVTGGGELAKMALQDGQTTWEIVVPGIRLAWFETSFGVLLAILSRLNLVSGMLDDIQETVHLLEERRARLMPESPVPANPAKRLAGQLVGRSICIFGADELAVVATRWKNQLNRCVKSWGQVEVIPESNHASLAGISLPEEPLARLFCLFLTGALNHPRNQHRLDQTRQLFMLQGINTDFLQARGKSRLAQVWSLLQFGEYTMYYLAAAYGENPAPDGSIEMFKRDLHGLQ